MGGSFRFVPSSIPNGSMTGKGRKCVTFSCGSVKQREVGIQTTKKQRVNYTPTRVTTTNTSSANLWSNVWLRILSCHFLSSQFKFGCCETVHNVIVEEYFSRPFYFCKKRFSVWVSWGLFFQCGHSFLSITFT